MSVKQDAAKLREQAVRLAKFEAWRRGDLYYLLDSTQRKIYDRIAKSKHRRHFFCCSRRLGKSFLLTVLAFEAALRKPGARILYLAPWAKDATDILREHASKILGDCPVDFKPEYNSQAKEFAFRNGAVIKIKGTNGETAQFLRGGSADLVVLDEAGTMDDLASVVKDVVDPMIITTYGSVILATTPAKTPGHDSKKICDELFKKGCGFEFTLLDNVRLTNEQKGEALESAGEDPADIPAILSGKLLPKTTTALREYWCQWVTDAGSAIVPEFDSKARGEIVRERERPPYFDAYTAMDPGMVDNSGILFAHWDVREQILVIEDEWLEKGAGTSEIAAAIRRKEDALWKDLRPFARYCDTELRLISDLIVDFGISFSPVIKKDSEAAVFNMRQMIKSRKICIHPRCVGLIRQLTNATWNKRGSDMARDESEEGLDGHYDLVAALKYLCRMISKSHNPYPENYYDANFGQSGGWRAQRKEYVSLRPDTPLSAKLNKAGL